MKKQFDENRSGTGTAEWSEYTEDICRGCINDCLYCYAAAKAVRFRVRSRKDWHIEEFNQNSQRTSYPVRDGVIMFPSSHDITPHNLSASIRIMKLILEKGNHLLMVSKPRMSCIELILRELEAFKDQILFRFTIGTVDDEISLFWEPGAPLPRERIDCLEKAKAAGYRTSVSIEPMLGGYACTEKVILAVREHVTDTIWVGKMNKARLRVDLSKEQNRLAVEKIEKLQADDEIFALVERFQTDPVIRWKDSIKEVIAKGNEKKTGFDRES